MEAVWYCLLTFVVATYVVTDGFDLGAGMLHLWVARTEAERQQVIRSIGPVWDGNEVWLLATGGTMFLAFPILLGTALSGFYLPIMLVLWLLLGRALGIELRHQVADPMWTALWDAVFWLSSTLLVVLLGAALGNVVRGVTFASDGHFFVPLWTHFSPAPPVGALDWYTVLVALAAVSVLLHHGALWLEWRTDEEVKRRAGRLASWLFWLVLVLGGVCTAASFAVQPRIAESLATRPWLLGFALPALAIGAVPFLRRRGRLRLAFLASAAHIYGLLAAAAVSLYPWLLPGTGPTDGITTMTAKAGNLSLEVGLMWWLPALALVLGCQAFVYSRLPKKVSVHDDAAH